MASIQAPSAPPTNTFTQAESASAAAVPKGSDQTPQSKPEHDENDTVTLSETGQKIVNLQRGQDLAKSLKEAPVDADFANSLKQATQDVFRIMKLFTQSVRSSFTWWRSN